MELPPLPTLREAARAWVTVAVHSFGGPAAQIAVMHRVVVDERRWIGEARFLHALNYCMLLPGPEAQQLATYLGWLLHGRVGGLVAGGLFVLPGFLAILGLSLAYVALGDLDVVAGLFFGLQAAVLAVVVEAVHRLGTRVLTRRSTVAVAVASFAAMLLLDVPFPAIVVVAGLIGLLGHRVAPGSFDAIRPREATGAPPALLDAWLDAHPPVRPALARTATTLGVGVGLWLAPVGVLVGALGPANVHAQIATFFAGAATVTFGGAYSVLAYVAQHAVEARGWLTADEMLDGLALAETTPGPLVQVVQFVAFLAAWRDPGAMSPWASAVLASVLATWVTFAPSFVWVFAGAPHVEALRQRRELTAALSAITAAVVGVVLHLAVWLAGHVLLGPPPGPTGAAPGIGSIDVAATAIAAGSALALLRWHVPLLRVLAVAGVAGAVWRLATG